MIQAYPMCFTKLFFEKQLHLHKLASNADIQRISGSEVKQFQLHSTSPILGFTRKAQKRAEVIVTPPL